ncbi:hypothetical protein OFY17_11785 [Marinomonas sp. C2222]|uniref:Uncharacterized protein n=1 Tax=Marinomonas sargassi TaxID=2984494 RepID=A0ABT2YUI2_9GAMM|nr:hypothetical protein [Marinomonas sargassi]MCV2403553.1 hypothetical protein [Marinomonas sargassi]
MAFSDKNSQVSIGITKAVISGFLFFCYVTANAAGLSLDELMGTTSPENSKVQESSPALAPSPQPTKAGSSIKQNKGLSLDGIFEARDSLLLTQNKARLASDEKRLSKRCSCVSSNCYNNFNNSSRLNQANVKEAAKDASRQLTQQVSQVCQAWANNRSQDYPDSAAVERQFEVTKKVNTTLNKIDETANTLFDELASSDKQIRNQIAAQKSKASSFDWGKAIAMGMGAVAGGIGKLDIESQTKILQSIVKDSFDSGGGMSNLQSTVGNLNADLAAINKTTASNSTSGSSSRNSNKSFVINEQYQYSCPHGGTHTAPIQSYSMACGNAMKRYAKVAGCNLIDEMEVAQQSYYSACSSEMYQ